MENIWTKEGETDSCKNCIKEFITSFFRKFYLDKLVENEITGRIFAYIIRVLYQMGKTGIDERLILTFVFKKWDLKVCSKYVRRE